VQAAVVARQARVAAGSRASLSSAMIASRLASPWRPMGATMPSSARCARMALPSWVRWRVSIRRARCSIITLCCSTVFGSTKRIDGRCTASQIASASAASFFCRFTYGLT
jgi:hypothetical protein